MPSAMSAQNADRSIFQVRRPDTLQFSTIEGLCRMAGVGRHHLRRLVAREAADNGLDECDRVGRPGRVTIERTYADEYVVTDEGDGIPGDGAVLADLFSTGRPMLSGKALRSPRRGLLGNGVRCLVAAVALCGETITVETRGRQTVLRPRRIGPTDVVAVEASPRTVGTLVRYRLGEIIPRDVADLADARAAIVLAKAAGPAYDRRPNPRWLDADHLFETFATIEPADATVREVIAQLDGCSGAVAGKLAAPFGRGRTCRDMREAEVARLLATMQSAARTVKPRTLGLIGGDAFGERYDAHIVSEAELLVGGHEPQGRIPVLIEAWAIVTSRRGHKAFLRVFCNRTPAIAGVSATRSSGGRIWLSGAGLDNVAINVDGGDCELIVAIAAPLIPTTSLGKAADLSLLADDIAEALRRAFVRSRNRLPPDPTQPKPPRHEPAPKPPTPSPFVPSGLLARRLAAEAEAAGVSSRDLLVLSPRHDPFNETKASRRDAEWFATQVSRFVPTGRVHLRGLYYRCLSAGDVLLPDGRRFTGTHETADLIENAGKYARHLRLIPFTRIVDERAAPPELYDTEGNIAGPADPNLAKRQLIVECGGAIAMPSLEGLFPTIGISDVPQPRQPYRICLVSEKVSPGDVLRPIASEHKAELLLLTGEISETHAYGITARAAADGRPLRVLYRSDFDPSGWQMPVSLARKFQAHISSEFPTVELRLIRVALNLEQVVEFNLPDAPIKPGEKRAKRWLQKWGREQVEIDALAALRPEVLDQIVRNAIAPYYDPTLDDRFAVAIKQPDEIQAWFCDLPEFKATMRTARSAFRAVRPAIERLNKLSAEAAETLRKKVEAVEDKPEPPPVTIRPEIATAEPDDAVFDSRDDFATATRRLQEIKALATDDTDDGDADEGAL
jgi:hypothetical protein